MKKLLITLLLPVVFLCTRVSADIGVEITGAEFGTSAKVTKSGELVVSPLSYDQTSFNELAEINTAYNFYTPISNKQFVITGVLSYGDKQVSSSTNATVIIYEASTIDTVTVDKVLVQFEIGQNQSIPFVALQLLVNKGVWINAKTDDDDIHMTIMGYYIKEIE